MVGTVGIQEFDAAVECFFQLTDGILGPGLVGGVVDLGIGVPQAVAAEGGEAAGAADGLQVAAAVEGGGTEDLEACRQRNGGQTVAIIESFRTDLVEGGAEGHGGDAVVVAEGAGTDVGHAAGDVYGGDGILIGLPGGTAGSKIGHLAAAADGQGAAAEFPGDALTAGAGSLALGVDRHSKGQQQRKNKNAGKDLLHIITSLVSESFQLIHGSLGPLEQFTDAAAHGIRFRGAGSAELFDPVRAGLLGLFQGLQIAA